MAATADDYRWFADDLAVGLNFCLTFVRGLTPDEVLARAGATEPVEISSVAAVEGTLDALDSDAFSVVAATTVGDWTVIVEPNFFLATFDSIVRAWSERGELVSLYFNENTTPRFTWARAGEVVVTFDPGYPQDRSGRDPDRLTAALAEVGFDLSGEFEPRFQERTLALMERQTGVRLTPELLAGAVFRCAVAPWPDSPPPDPGDLAEAREQLAGYAADPDRDELMDVLWDEEGVADKRLRSSGHTGRTLAVNAPEAFHLLAAADDARLREVIRWGRERVLAEAELADQPWFRRSRDSLLRDEPISAADRAEAERHFDPDPGYPPFDRGGRLLLGARQRVAISLFDAPENTDLLTVACAVVQAVSGVLGGRSGVMTEELKRAFP
jgi:hypothetical protein